MGPKKSSEGPTKWLDRRFLLFCFLFFVFCFFVFCFLFFCFLFFVFCFFWFIASLLSTHVVALSMSSLFNFLLLSSLFRSFASFTQTIVASTLTVRDVVWSHNWPPLFPFSVPLVRWTLLARKSNGGEARSGCFTCVLWLTTTSTLLSPWFRRFEITSTAQVNWLNEMFWEHHIPRAHFNLMKLALGRKSFVKVEGGLISWCFFA